MYFGLGDDAWGAFNQQREQVERFRREMERPAAGIEKLASRRVVGEMFDSCDHGRAREESVLRG
jgi:hypothetical protein